MEKNTNQIVETPSCATCTSREIGELLFDYIVGLLAESAVEEVEDHLLECSYCEERYLRILGMRTTNIPSLNDPRVGPALALNDTRASGSAKVLRIAGFKKKLP